MTGDPGDGPGGRRRTSGAPTIPSAEPLTVPLGVPSVLFGVQGRRAVCVWEETVTHFFTQRGPRGAGTGNCARRTERIMGVESGVSSGLRGLRLAALGEHSPRGVWSLSHVGIEVSTSLRFSLDLPVRSGPGEGRAKDANEYTRAG